MPQEFLASFAVDIDEAGVSRLQSVLEQNRSLAEEVAAAFSAARASMDAFFQAASEDFSASFDSSAFTEGAGIGSSGITLPLNLDFTKARKDLAAFFKEAQKQIRLSADGSAIVSAARSAISQVRSLVESADITLKVKVETEGEVTAGGDTAVQLSSGGRFTSPTKAEIAEDGGTEYVIPVNKEERALPLLRQLTAELSPSAQETLRDMLSAPHAETLSGTLNVSAAVPQVIQQNTRSVQAPVSISVQASGAEAEDIGRSIYNTAERYLLRTLARSDTASGWKS